MFKKCLIIPFFIKVSVYSYVPDAIFVIAQQDSYYKWIKFSCWINSISFGIILWSIIIYIWKLFYKDNNFLIPMAP